MYAKLENVKHLSYDKIRFNIRSNSFNTVNNNAIT